MRIVAYFCIAAMSSQQAISGEREELSAIWVRYVETCESVTTSTEEAFENFPISEKDSSFVRSAEGTVLGYGWVSPNYTDATTIEIVQSDTQFSLICNVETTPSGGFQPAVAHTVLQEMIAESSELSISGGPMKFETGSVTSNENITFGTNWHSYRVLGAFQGVEVSTIFAFSAENISVYHFASISR